MFSMMVKTIMIMTLPQANASLSSAGADEKARAEAMIAVEVLPLLLAPTSILLLLLHGVQFAT